MIKYIFLIVQILLNLELSQAQIPNGSFEFWEEVLNYEKPVDWSTNQNTIYSRFEKDSISVEGNFSLKIIPGPMSSWDGCESRASVHADFGTPIAPNSALTFFVKSISVDSSINNNAYLRIYIYYADSITQFNTIVWSVPGEFETFTRFEIPLPDENIDAIAILISGGAGSNPSDGPCIHRTISWIDGMTIESVTSDVNSEFQKDPEISVYPNPSAGLINVSCVDKVILEYQLYSLTGKLISKGKLTNGQLFIHEKGIYVLKLVIASDRNGAFQSKLIVVK